MDFLRIEDAVNSWKSHKSSMSARGMDPAHIAEVESHMLRAIILLIVSEYEEYLEKMFVKRAAKSNDEHIRTYFFNHMDKKFRSPNLGKINDILKWMGGTYLQTFKDRVETNEPRLKVSWDSIVTARHAIVHKENAGVVNLNWQDMETAYADTKLVVQALADALQLSAGDIQSL